MLNPIAFANASSLVMAGLFVICRALVALNSNFMMSILQSWFHTINLSSLETASDQGLGSFVLGLVSLVVVTWILTYVNIYLYNILANKK